MCTNIIFELSMHLDSREFSEIIRYASDDLKQISDSDDEFLDTSMISKGMLVRYRDSLYKKKITLIIDVRNIIGQSDMDSDKLNRKISKRIAKEALIKSRLTAWYASCLHIFCHLAQISLDGRQPVCTQFIQSDKKSDCAICAPDLISASLSILTAGSLLRTLVCHMRQ